MKKSQYEIPIFGCQLATNSEGRPEMKGTKRLEPKLDGVRVLLVVIYNDAGEIITTCYSRNGKVFENFTHIYELSLLQVCPYLEFLLRYMDMKRIGDKRWFLTLVDAVRALPGGAKAIKMS